MLKMRMKSSNKLVKRARAIKVPMRKMMKKTKTMNITWTLMAFKIRRKMLEVMNKKMRRIRT